MNRDTFGVAGAEKLSDAALSAQLGRYQRQARTSLRVGLLSIAGGLIAAVAMQNTALKAVIVAVLFGGGLCCVLFLSSGAQRAASELAATWSLRDLFSVVKRAALYRPQFVLRRGRRIARAVL